MALSPYEELDLLLTILKIKGSTSIDTIIDEFKSNNIEIDWDYAKALLNKLEKDGYVTRYERVFPMGKNGINVVTFDLSFEGKLFIADGKYVAKLLNDATDLILREEEIKRLRHVDVQSLNNAMRLNSLTLKLVFVTVLLFALGFVTIVWDAIKFCFEKEHGLHDILKKVLTP